jgi:nucleotide-binding universal stress UspA family protein
MVIPGRYTTIGVPLDGSAFGECALPTAVAIARAATATLRLIHVRTPTIDWIDDNLRRQDEEYLQRVAERAAAAGVRARPVLLAGRPADVLTQYAADGQLDLIVMSTHGRGPFNRAWLGSVADQMVRQVSVPVLLVRPRDGVQGEVGEGQLFRNIIVPLDGSGLAETILDHALTLARLSAATCTLVSVVRPRIEVGAHIIDLSEAQQREAVGRVEQYLDAVRARLGDIKEIVNTRVMLHLVPSESILASARDLDADLIALATHGRGGVRRLLIGSTADKVLRATHTPVLVYRPPS